MANTITIIDPSDQEKKIAKQINALTKFTALLQSQKKSLQKILLGVLKKKDLRS